MQDVAQLAERIIVIDQGKILSDGSLDSLTERFTSAKLITVTLETQIDQAKLARFGQIQSYDFPRVVFKVNRKQVKSKALSIIKLLPIVDISIEEPDIEQVIRDVFEENSQAKSNSQAKIS
jgi:ABC-2 type transport system ATP-binding protein